MVGVLPCFIGWLGAYGGETDVPVRVECHGQLRTGLIAIGGETTGTVIKFNGITWELRFKDDTGKAFASSRHKLPVSVTGSLRRVTGVEVPIRWIVDVDRIAERDSTRQKEGATVRVQGILRRDANTEVSGQSIVIQAEELRWPLDLTAEADLIAKAETSLAKQIVVEGQLEPTMPHSSTEKLSIRVTRLTLSSQTHK